MFEDFIERDGVDLERRDRERKTPLVVLASRLSNDCANSYFRTAMKGLLHRGVNPNAQDISGRTALHYLCDPKFFGPFIFHAIVGMHNFLSPFLVLQDVGHSKLLSQLSWNILHIKIPQPSFTDC